MSSLVSPLHLNTEAVITKSPLKLEQLANRRRFISVISLMLLVLNLVSFIVIIPTVFNLNSNVNWLSPSLNFISVICLGIAWQLNRVNRPEIAAWIVLVASVMQVTIYSFNSGTLVTFAIVLLATIALIILGAIAAYITLSWGFLLAVYPIISSIISSQAVNPQEISVALTIIFVVIPTIWLSSYLLNNLNKASRIATQQALDLATALENIEQKQAIGERVSQNIFSMTAELNATATQQKSGSQEQVATINQVSNSVKELSGSAVSVAEVALTVDELVGQMAQSGQFLENVTNKLAQSFSQQGLQAVKHTLEANNKVSLFYQNLVETNGLLTTKTTNIRSVVDLLSSISSETHLLSLNAAIEAAGAGEYGARFGVVAHEVKHLADRSAAASKEVLIIVKELEEAVSQAVKVAQDGYSVAQGATQVAEQTGMIISDIKGESEVALNAARDISLVAREVKSLAGEIKMATSMQRSASEQVVAALANVVLVSQQNAAGSVQVAHSAKELEQLSYQLTETLTT